MTVPTQDNLMGAIGRSLFSSFWPMSLVAMAMKSLLVSVAMSACARANVNEKDARRELKLQHLAGFVPVTQVADQASIDQDQKLMVKYLEEKTEESFQIARNIYEKGAFSRSYATVTMKNPLPENVDQGTLVHGITVDGDPVLGEVLRPTPKGQTTLNILYDTSDSDVDYTGCRVAANPSPVKSGCFAADGFLTIDGIADSEEYYYSLQEGNKCDRTIESMSRHADYKMRPCGKCDYYRDFNRFYEYYGRPDYADQWIDKAFEGKAIEFKHGQWDFSHYSFESRAEAIKRATVYLSIANYISKQLDDAFYKCQNRKPCTGNNCDINDVRMMEGGLAFYAGSLEGQDGKGVGVLLYDLADRMCQEFKTCGDKGDATSGTSNVNHQIISEFQSMQKSLLSHKCAEARTHQDRIGALLYVPLFQGTLKQAYITSKDADSTDEEAAGAAFAASVLPVVAKCRQDDASIIFENMKPGHEKPADFAAVKGAIERNLGCFKLTCEDIGGYYYRGVGGAIAHYYEGAEPCVSAGAPVEDTSLTAGQIAGITLGVFMATILACCCYIYSKLPKKRRAAVMYPSSGESA